MLNQVQHDMRFLFHNASFLIPLVMRLKRELLMALTSPIPNMSFNNIAPLILAKIIDAVSSMSIGLNIPFLIPAVRIFLIILCCVLKKFFLSGLRNVRLYSL